MALAKRNYVSGETVITAKNLNEIQDSIIALEGTAGDGGAIPHIGDNGNWYIGSTDTGKPSRGAVGAPGKDGAGMDITGATVGQIVKIAAVDESGVPTAWSPVDMPSGSGGETWEKLVDASLAEAVESVTYTLDNCKRIKALIAPMLSRSENVTGWKSFTINNVSYQAFNSTVHSYDGICFRIDSEYPPYVQLNVTSNQGTSERGINGGQYTTVLENIAVNGITEFGCQTAKLLKAGTKIEIWGVKS